MELREARPPGRILQAYTDEVTATTIKFRIVGPANDGGLPITAFVAQYKEEADTWDQYEVKSWATDQAEYVIEDLLPLKRYNFRFAAENHVGLGEWSQEKVEIMPSRAAPEKPILHVETFHGVAHTPYSNNYELRWVVPPDNGERIEAFEISYTPVCFLPFI